MTGLHRIGVKVFCAKCEVDAEELIPVFHRWIQQKRLPHMLIDVADYTHVPAGPGILLVSHEGNYTFDEAQNRRGLSFVRKQPTTDGDLSANVRSIARDTVSAAIALEEEPELAGRVAFDGGELRVFFNDRLNAENTDETCRRYEPEVSSFFDLALGRERSKAVRGQDARERLAFASRAAGPVSLRELAARLAR